MTRAPGSDKTTTFVAPSDRPKARGATTYAYYEGNWRKLPNFDQA